MSGATAMFHIRVGLGDTRRIGLRPPVTVKVGSLNVGEAIAQTKPADKTHFQDMRFPLVPELGIDYGSADSLPAK
jgi:hypothetical protein